MRSFGQLTDAEQQRAIETRLHYLMNNGDEDWPANLRARITAQVAGIGAQVSTKDAHALLLETVRNYFMQQATEDARDAIYPDTGELVIVLEDETTINTKGAAVLVFWEGVSIVERRIRRAAEKRVLGGQ